MQPPVGWSARAARWAALVLAAAGCSATPGAEWVSDLSTEPPPPESGWDRPASDPRAAARPGATEPVLPPSSAVTNGAGDEPEDGDRPLLKLEGTSRGKAAASEAPSPELYRNTYYDFPREGGGAKRAKVYDASCAPIAEVTADFHDRVCVQGSGRLASGATVSFAKRGCACAAVCPRTGQQICYERLDPARFPHGRGAMGHPITPLRTVAVDSSVIPLGTVLFIPEYAGIAGPDGARHDGCFVAEDRGVKVVGRQIDVFTGDPEVTRVWNAAVPSNQGVHVWIGDRRCAKLARK